MRTDGCRSRVLLIPEALWSMTPTRRLRAPAPTLLLFALCLSGCRTAAEDTPETASWAGPFASEEASALRDRWDYVEGWFGGDLMRFGHLNVHRLVPTVQLESGEGVRPLPESPRPEVASLPVVTGDRGTLPLDEYVSSDPRVDGFLVLHDGEIVYERYVHMRPEDRHLWFSVSKLVAGLLISDLEDQGVVDVSRPVERYVPGLAGSGWEGVTIRDVLDMSSGIDCPEDADAYADIGSCMLVMERSVGMQPELPTVAFRPHMASMTRRVEPGTEYEYASANTSMLMYLAEVVTGERYPELVSARLWRHVGAEAEALVIAGDYGDGEAAAAHAGLFTTLRDLGRLGLFLLDQEGFHRKLMEDARPALFSDASWGAYRTAGDRPTHAAWQTDVVFPDGDFGKGGWGGQFLYVSPSRDLVVAWFGTFAEDLVDPDLQSVARQLATAPGLWSP